MNSSGNLTISTLFDITDKISNTSSFYDISDKILSPLAQLIGAESSVFLKLKKNKENVRASDFISNTVDKKNASDYEKYFQQVDPVLPHAYRSTQSGYKLFQSKSFSFTLDKIVDPQKFICGKYYNEFLRPNSIRQLLAIGIPSRIDNSLIYLFGFHRYGHRPFQQKDSRASSYFGPALHNILDNLELTRRLHDSNIVATQLQDQVSDTGLIITNMNYEVIFANLTGQKHFSIKLANNCHYSNLENDLIIELKAHLPQTGISHTRQIEFEHGRIKVSACIVSANNQEQRIILHSHRSNYKTVSSLEIEKYELTHREIYISNLIIMGMTTPEISDKLCISARTVENHLRAIYAKTGVRNRTSLAFKLSRQEK